MPLGIQSVILYLFFTVLLITPVCSVAQIHNLIGHAELLEDTRQFASLLEKVHPQPYLHGGGKIAFHRLFQNILLSIPDNGMTREDFRGLLSPLAASIGDGHTYIYPDSPFDMSGIPLIFYVVEKDLYVSAVIEEKHKNLFGARILSIEGVEFSKIINRTKQYYGADNIYGTLAQLGNFENFLSKKSVLEDLVPEWIDQSVINVTFQMPNGNIKKVEFESHPRQNFSFLRPDPVIELPNLNGLEFGWGYLSESNNIAYLRVSSMIRNRETFEKRATYSDVSEEARDFYQSLYGKETNVSIDEVIAALPALMETYIDLVVQMKESNASTLVVDLRTNVGGWALSADMLIYFLYGKEALIDLHRRTNISIRKLSPYYLNNDPDESLIEINSLSKTSQQHAINLTETDYDFRDYEKMKNGKLLQEYSKQIVEADLALSKSFYDEYVKGTYSNYFCPGKIYVITDVATFSAGFMFAKYLELMGATVVGSTPSQNIMQMGETVHYELNNSKLNGSISHSLLIHDSEILNGPEPQNLLTPHYELTYAKLKEYNFARHSVIMYLLEIVNSQD